MATTLPRLLAERVSALQVMFTACRTTCPIQGAIFARVQKLLADQVARGIQLVSLSVDPAHDTSVALSHWLRRFGARPGWRAAAPRPADVEQVRAFFGAGRTATDNHSTQVQLFDRTGSLVWRTGELPEAEESRHAAAPDLSADRRLAAAPAASRGAERSPHESQEQRARAAARVADSAVATRRARRYLSAAGLSGARVAADAKAAMTTGGHDPAGVAARG